MWKQTTYAKASSFALRAMEDKSADRMLRWIKGGGEAAGEEGRGATTAFI